MKRFVGVVSFATLLMAVGAAAARSQPVDRAADMAASRPARTGHVAVRGVDYFYEIRGKGPPLLLLHGALGSGGMFAPIMSKLGAGCQVIAVDLQGHGRTPLGTREFSLEAQGDDMDAILGRLGYGKVDVMGYSLGGGVALQFAAQHPQRVRRLLLVSTGFSSMGFYPAILQAQGQLSAPAADAMKGTPMYRSYMSLAPHPEDFPRLLDVLGRTTREPYDFSAAVATLTMPTLLVYGDADLYRPEHEVEFFQKLGGGLRDSGQRGEAMPRSHLAVLPGLTHYDIFMSPALAQTAVALLARAASKTSSRPLNRP